MENLFMELLKISVLCSVGILLVFTVSPLLRKTHTVFWRYCLWVLLAVRLLLPFDFSLSGQAVVISLPVRMTVGERTSVILSESGREDDAKKADPMDNASGIVAGISAEERAENMLTAQDALGEAGIHETENDKTENGGAGSGQIYNAADIENAGNIGAGSGRIRNATDTNEDPTGRNTALLSSGHNLQKNRMLTSALQAQNAGIPGRVSQWAAIVWVLGVFALLVWQAACYAIFSRNIKKTRITYGQKGPLSVYISPVVSTPMLIGILKPQIVLPGGKYTKEELDFILDHEFTHYKRKDLWIKLLLALTKTLHWFNPLVFWMERQAVQDMELLCDDGVIRGFSREEKKLYGAALLNCASSKRSRMAVLCTSEFSRDVKMLKERFANIFSGGGKKRGIFVVGVGVSLLVSGSLFVMLGVSGCGSEGVSQESSDPASEETIKGFAKETEQGSQGEEDSPAKEVSSTAQGKPAEEQQDEQQPGDNSLFSQQNTYTWQEITVSIPDAWEGRYQVLESEDGFALMQKASNEKNEGMGMLCGFYRVEGMLIDYAGTTPLAFTDTHTYYMVEPTDVNYDYEDEEIARDYHEMYDLITAVFATVTIDKEDVKYNPEEYILPLSNTVLVTEDELFNFSDNELKLARNEIYARHGRQFKDSWLAAYFDSCSWYEGTVPPEEFDEGKLSQTEKENLKMIRKAEETYQAEHPYPKEYKADSQASEDLDQDGRTEKISCEFKETDTWIAINGTKYALSDFGVQLDTPNTEVFYVTDINPYQEGLEIALLDYGPSEDHETHFFSYQDGLHYLGSVSGFPFAQQSGRNGFMVGGYVIGESRMDFTHTSSVYDSWWYDLDEQKLVHEETGYYDIVPEGAHSLSEDITVYQEMDETHMKKTLPAQDEVFFLETDGKEWVLVKGKDGTKGYMHIVDGKIAGLSKEPGEVFSGLDFVD